MTNDVVFFILGFLLGSFITIVLILNATQEGYK